MAWSVKTGDGARVGLRDTLGGVKESAGSGSSHCLDGSVVEFDLHTTLRICKLSMGNDIDDVAALGCPGKSVDDRVV